MAERWSELWSMLKAFPFQNNLNVNYLKSRIGLAKFGDNLKSGSRWLVSFSFGSKYDQEAPDTFRKQCKRSGNCVVLNLLCTYHMRVWISCVRVLKALTFQIDEVCRLLFSFAVCQPRASRQHLEWFQTCSWFILHRSNFLLTMQTCLTSEPSLPNLPVWPSKRSLTRRDPRSV